MASRKKPKLSNDDEANAPHNGAVSKTPKHGAGGSRPTARPTRSRKGCLESVQSLPLDVSLQVFGHLHPKDLLNLARTSKAFRSFFLSRATSISIWKSSLLQVEGLPEKPTFLSEPAFAHLLFNPFCQNCGKSGIQKPIWPWFVRYCMECTDKLSSSIFGADLDWSLMSLMLKPGDPIFNMYLTPGPNGFRVVHKPQLKRFAREWKKCGTDEGQRGALIEKQRKATEEQAMLARRFEVWHTAKQKHRSAELERIRKQRLQDILERLGSEDSEWLPEMEHFGEAHVHYHVNDVPAVRQPSRLTDRVWPKVLAAIRGQMEVLRTRRLREEREEQMKERLHELAMSILKHYVHLPKTASMDCRPNAQILLGEKECFDLVVAPRDHKVTRHDFAEVLPEVCSRWQESCAEKLRGLVRTAIPAIPEDVDPLDLAVAVFECKRGSCSGRVAHRYPSLLAHTCNCKNNRKYSQTRQRSDVQLIAAWLPEWNGIEKYEPPSRMKIQPFIRVPRVDSVIRMQYIVSALGLDPTHARHEEISDARLWCRVCSPSSRTVYTWEAAFFHVHSGYLVDRDFWEQVIEEDMATIQQLEEKGNPVSKDKLRWGCTLCRDWDSIGAEVESHLKEKHQMEDLDQCIADGTLYLHFNQPFRSTYPMVLPGPDGPESGPAM